jgi:hypothetical protein
VAISTERSERFAAYAASHVWLEHPTLGAMVLQPSEPGVADGPYPAQRDVTIHIVTAHNPGRLLSPDENDVRARRLLADVESMGNVTVWRSVGGDPEWTHTEDCLALIGLDDDAVRALGRRYDQEAIWAWDATMLRLIECEAAGVMAFGWRTEPWDGAPPPG